MAEKRYRIVCVAPEVQGRGSFDDLDEALLHTDANFEVYDRETKRYHGLESAEHEAEVRKRVREKNGRYLAKAFAHRFEHDEWPR